MEQGLSNEEYSYQWIIKCIDSSATPFHIDGCQRLIELYKERFGESEKYKLLIDTFIHKRDQINYF